MKPRVFAEITKDLKTATRFIGLVHSVSRRYIPMAVVSSAFRAILPFLNIIMPKFILDELMGEQRLEALILYVSIVVIGNGVLNLVNRVFEMKMTLANDALNHGLELHLGRHIMNMDYESLEDPAVLNQKDEALFPIHNQGAIWNMIHSITVLVQTTITLLGLVAIIATLNLLIIFLILAIVGVNAALFRKSQATQFEFHRGLIPLHRRVGYYFQLTSNFTMAKDVRIYGMAPYILGKISEYTTKSIDAFGRLFGIMGLYEGVSNINLQVQMVFVYAYMVWRVFVGAIGIGDFTMYISAANNFSSNIASFLGQFIRFRQMCRYLDLYVQFEAIPSRQQGGSKIPATDRVEIEFRNVWFRYPRAQEYALKDLSITIQNGERLSVVGQNGAGKTTFIKLLCRLYEPEKGEILLNGVNIKEYNYEAYTRLLSVVFQDFKLFSFTIQENLAFDGVSDEARIEEAVEKAGISKKVNSLEKGILTSLYKNFDESGVELSGGEMQKLAIARAIYRNTPLVVLDEPTAALDPYAEYEIYSKFYELIQGKTAIYISHRLSSCRFCDRIAVFEEGQLIEVGTHRELTQKGGHYWEMWQAQAQYYA